MFGMKMRQGDNSLSKRKVPKTAPDDSGAANAKRNVSLTAPNLPERDGPARDKIDGGKPMRPATSAKPKTSKKTMAAMKKSLGGIGRY